MVLAPGLGSTSHLLTEPRRQAVGDHPHQGIDRAAGIERNDDAIGLVGQAFSARATNGRASRRRQRCVALSS